MHPWGRECFFKGHSLLLCLLWSLWQPQEVDRVSIIITISHMRFFSSGGCRVIFPESQSYVVAVLELQPRFSEKCYHINGLCVPSCTLECPAHGESTNSLLIWKFKSMVLDICRFSWQFSEMQTQKFLNTSWLTPMSILDRTSVFIFPG